MIAGAFSLGMNHFSPSGIALLGQWDKSKGVVTPKSKQDMVHGDIEINNPLRVLEMLKNKEVVLVDVRPGHLYDQGHLPGALSFPLNDFEENLEQIQAALKPDAPILVYCSGIECSDSHGFASKLVTLKFTQVRVYAGGFSEWQEMGFEIEKK